MKQRIQTEKFNTGSYAQPRTSEPIDKFTNRSQMKHSGLDPLKAALGHSKPTLPSGNHTWNNGKTPKAGGAHYKPSGSFGPMSRTGAGKGVYSYGGNRKSAPSTNAVGNPPNRTGQNAIAGRFRPTFSGKHQP